ncbi:hypothetical protein K445DRAFT_318772 [Daldinia sp. EC12]|nr:hypothetical protein K445DRAFT_318772 [Daldinia sp. EC12]
MNTTDIRDTNRDQTLFWTISIPVTFVVLSISFLYGYKGEAIEDRVIEFVRARSERRHKELPQEKVKTVSWGTVLSAEDNQGDDAAEHHSKSWLTRVKKRNRISNRKAGRKASGFV